MFFYVYFHSLFTRYEYQDMSIYLFYTYSFIGRLFIASGRNYQSRQIDTASYQRKLCSLSFSVCLAYYLSVITGQKTAMK